jgi:hypothetical protein
MCINNMISKVHVFLHVYVVPYKCTYPRTYSRTKAVGTSIIIPARKTQCGSSHLLERAMRLPGPQRWLSREPRKACPGPLVHRLIGGSAWKTTFARGGRQTATDATCGTTWQSGLQDHCSRGISPNVPVCPPCPYMCSQGAGSSYSEHTARDSAMGSPVVLLGPHRPQNGTTWQAFRTVALAAAIKKKERLARTSAVSVNNTRLKRGQGGKGTAQTRNDVWKT